jgi:diguanylate cyclase (GGDEF)-like protein
LAYVHFAAEVNVSPGKANSTARLLAPIVAVSTLVAALIGGILLWSSNEVDRISRERDRAIVSHVLSRTVARVGHVQESSTVWDEAVRQLAKRPVDGDWLDLNLGVWFNSYAGHDEVYLLDGGAAPLYAMRNGKRASPSAYDALEDVVRPLVTELRGMTDPAPRGDDDMATLSPGAADLATVRGRPAIVSAKPVISDTGELVQQPGSEAVHVSVVFLDNAFISRLSGHYGLAGGRYSPTASPQPGEAAAPLLNRSGRPIGYFIWRPFAPGGDVRDSIAPFLLIALALAGVVVFLLTHRLGRRTMDLEASKAQAQHLALHDVMTGLPNRAMFENRLDAALARTGRDGSRLALLYIDLDRFKEVNDTLGHPAGDALIREVAHRLLALVRGYDTVARIGGDEFAIIQVGPESQAATEAICRRIVEELSRPFELMGAQSDIGASVGIAVAPEDGYDRNELSRKADIALYRAKLDGRGRHAFFCPSMDEAIKARETIESDLRKALADCDNQLKVHYQPVFSMATGAMTAVEALLRWDHPEKGLVSPAAFIAFAEESGLIELLGECVLRTAMRDAAGWPGIRISVNVSPIQTRSRSFADMVMRMLAEAEMEPERLELEITETALLDGSPEVAGTLSELRARGIGIALDDFGTGYSSLSHIRDLAVDRIKIDRSFITAIETGNGAALIQAIAALAHANGLRLTAEGVETHRQRELLEAVGCDEMQGFLLSRPVTAEEITSLLLSGKHADDFIARSRAA